MQRINLVSKPWVKPIIKNRWPQLIIIIMLLAGFIFAIFSGWFGTPVGNQNFSVVFVWIAWWAILILIAVPLLGRGWCSVCPIPAPGEWVQRGWVVEPGGKSRWLNLRWPNKLRNMWLQNTSFLLVALFSAVILTTPSVTAAVLAGMLFLSFGLSLVFQRRTFCRYVCPVGGFIGLFAQAAPIELRIQNKQTCVSCQGKPCYNGSEQGQGCPWDVFPGGLSKNTYCGLCLECTRTCPQDNIAINLRPFAADLDKPSSKIDEAYKAFIMLGAALVYAAVLLGPWGALKQAAFQVGSLPWIAYAAGFLVFILGVVPGGFALAVKAGQAASGWRGKFSQVFANFAAALIPLGLMFWMAFSLSFVLSNATYILASLSDPLGWGWNLFGTAGLTWQPILSGLLPALQILALAVGLYWSARTAQKISQDVHLPAAPVIIFCTATTSLMLWLLV